MLRHSWAKLLALTSAMSCASMAHPAVIYHADFEDGTIPGWAIPKGREEHTGLELASRDAGDPTWGDSVHCLRFVGTRMWNTCDLMLEEPVTLDRPTYLLCAWRSEGQVGQMGVNLHIEGQKRPIYSKTGPVGRLAVGRWDWLVARLDQFGSEVEGGRLLGLRFATRCVVGAELPEGRAPQHATVIDDISILTPPDSARAETIARELAAPREYQGPERFLLHRSADLAVWHTPSLAPAFEGSPVCEAEGDAIRLRAARREAESVEIVATLEGTARVTLSLQPGPLTGPTGVQIPGENVKWHPVRFVPLSTRLGFPLELQWPDPLSHDREVTVEQAGHVPFWVTVHVPPEAQPGTYRGTTILQVAGDLQTEVEVPVELEVLAFELPLRPAFRTNQQLWGVKRGQARPWLEELAERKLFDANMWYSLPEERAWRMHELGQNAIKINMVGGHGPKPTQYGGHDIRTPGHAQAYTEHLEKQLAWIRENGWEQHAFIYIWDENWGSQEVFDMVDHLAGLLRKRTSEVPILGALPVNPKIEGVVNIYLAEYSPTEVVERRLAAGDEFWRWGNVDLQLGKSAMAVRLSYGFEPIRRKFTGAYSWGVSAWGDRDPWTDFDRANWGGSLFYPGAHEGSQPDRPVPSIRMELLRDGIEDFEYATLLRSLIAQAQGQNAAPVQQGRDLLRRAEGLCDPPSHLRRCDQGIDELLDLRRLIQDAILALGADV